MACSFDLAKKVRLDDGSDFDTFKTPHYLMLAFGHYIDNVPVGSLEYGEQKKLN